MILTIKNHTFKYDLETLCRVFFPFEKMSNDVGDNSAIVVETERAFLDKSIFLSVKATVFGKTTEKAENLPLNEKEEEQLRVMTVLLYNALGELLDYYPQWGILTGVRSAKVLHKLTEEFDSKEKAQEYFENKLLVTKKKSNLTVRVTKAEDKIIGLSQPNSFSLYISIPFCPTRCSYCSFVSNSMKSAKQLIEPFVKLLCGEIKESGKIAKQLGLRLETVYFGGGTPTTLSPEQLRQVIRRVKDSFNMETVREFTVEAGRPDTITEEKLIALKDGGVERISINPQSFNDDVLKAIGRNHTSQQTLEAFHLARKVGFNNINMDFIAGLPMDDIASFKRSIDMAVNLGAENITVHTLSMKRASTMVINDLVQKKRDARIVDEMVDYSNEKLSNSGYYPYYMYRQSKTAGNLENVGWCKKGKDCLYNVYMMDETHSVFACGAGAVTKFREPNGGHIERIYNYKYPFEYNSDFQEMINRKQKMISFYQQYPLERENNGQQ